jgi:hypothetical protein
VQHCLVGSEMCIRDSLGKTLQMLYHRRSSSILRRTVPRNEK